MFSRLAAGARAACTALLLLAAPTAWCASDGVAVRGIGEAVLAFRASSLKRGELPPSIVVRNAPQVFRTQISLACLGLPLQPQDLLLYFTESRHCQRMPAPRSVSENQDSKMAGLAELSQSQATVEAALQKQALVVLQPQVQAAPPAGLCICRGDSPPDISISAGSQQTVFMGDPIQTVVFSASDVDSPSLSYEFSWRLDGGASQPGLPGTLAPSCSAGPGTLDCTIDGLAPAQFGLYKITIIVADGINYTFAEISISVTTILPTELPIFLQGFEDD